MSDPATRRYDVVVIGAVPAGQKAAVQAAKGGLSVAVCEQRRYVGGACVQFGTIPSKALRERALRRCWRPGGLQRARLDSQVSVADLIGEVDDVVRAHDAYMAEQLRRNGIDVWHGRARFESPHRLRLRGLDGGSAWLEAGAVVIAGGSVPRRIDAVPVDHEHVYDSDSILTLPYLPRSLLVLGGGVIACEYASVFALLGVEVTLLDRGPRPLGFLDVDLSDRFLEGFRALGGRFIGHAAVRGAAFDGLAAVSVALESGVTLTADKVLCALGRVADLEELGIGAAGLALDDRGLIAVNGQGQTAVAHIYAAGDVIGPPALASAAMEQGRRAACHLLGIEPGSGSDFTPSGIYAVPELASVGLAEADARARHHGVQVGVARFAEIARGHIAGTQEGFLKLVVGADRRLLGVHVAGDQATELVHMGQMALIHGAAVDVFIDNVFNFPTYGEAYRVAALDAARRL
ncbi:MAG: Si-specific NAD(P)(+) transhydrogenase [Pseudomonadales bacterium]